MTFRMTRAGANYPRKSLGTKSFVHLRVLCGFSNFLNYPRPTISQMKRQARNAHYTDDMRIGQLYAPDPLDPATVIQDRLAAFPK